MNCYSAKLTGEPFLYNETKIIGSYLLEGEDPIVLRKRNIEENLIQQKKKASLSRTNSPIFRRLSVFNDEMLDVFVNGDISTSKMLLVYAIMKTDNIVKDFIDELYRTKILEYKDYIEDYEIVNWFDNIYQNSNLNTISDTTKYKLRQVLIKIMVDSNLLKKEETRFMINAPILSDRFKTLLSNVGDIDYYKAIGGIV